MSEYDCSPRFDSNNADYLMDRALDEHAVSTAIRTLLPPETPADAYPDFERVMGAPQRLSGEVQEPRAFTTIEQRKSDDGDHVRPITISRARDVKGGMEVSGHTDRVDSRTIAVNGVTMVRN